MLPLSFDVTIRSDSQAALAAISCFRQLTNQRKRLRMAARPLLQLVSKLINSRQGAGGSVSFAHVRAHSDNTDIASVGNRLADYQANVSRAAGIDRSTPLNLGQLPLEQCEWHLQVSDASAVHAPPIIDDIRRSAVERMRMLAMSKWLGSDNILTSNGMVELGRAVLKQGSAQQQAAFVHVATNTVHWHRPDAEEADGSSTRCRELECEQCAEPMTIGHMASCPQSQAARLRAEVRDIFSRHLATLSPSACRWLQQRRGMPLQQLMGECTLRTPGPL
jgi:hypothetical protein